MRDNFDKALSAVLQHEGGYVNDPHDPGGATMKGVTQAVYDDWRKDRNLSTRPVKIISPAEILAIYKSLYWDPIKGDKLPAGIDYAIFDYGVNSGVGRAARALQQAVGAVPDGLIGPATLGAVNGTHKPDLIDKICDGRLRFLQHLATFEHFGKGWTRRVEDVRVKAKAMLT